MAKENTNTKITKKTTNRKKTTGKKSNTRKKVTELNLWAYNENCDLEMVKVPIQHRMNFLYRFGVMTPPDKQQVLEWLESIKNV